MKNNATIVVCGGITVFLENVMPAKRPQLKSDVPHYRTASAAATDRTAKTKGRGAITQVKVQVTGGKSSKKTVKKLVKIAGQKRFVVKK